MGRDQAIQIARDYLQQEYGIFLPVVFTNFNPGEEITSMFYRHPTWSIWFETNVPYGIEPREHIIYVEVETQEAWELDMAG
ncbi:MAG: hypothetical protein M3Y13_10605 [Armatimonadota bacterium]|nr:hypothetical protein [Armatimonadota bacterium]